MERKEAFEDGGLPLDGGDALAAKSQSDVT